MMQIIEQIKRKEKEREATDADGDKFDGLQSPI